MKYRKEVLLGAGLGVVVGVAVYFYAVRWFIPLHSIYDTNETRVQAFPYVTVSQLIKNAAQYNGSKICTDGWHMSGWEYSNFGGSWFPNIFAGTVIRQGDIWIQSYRDLGGERCGQTLIGRESCLRHFRICGLFETGDRFGHLGGWSHSITEIETVDPSPKKISELVQLGTNDWQDHPFRSTLLKPIPTSINSGRAICAALSTESTKKACLMDLGLGFSDPSLCEESEFTDVLYSATERFMICVENMATARQLYDCRQHTSDRAIDLCYYVEAVSPFLYRPTEDCSVIKDNVLREECEEFLSLIKSQEHEVGSISSRIVPLRRTLLPRNQR